MTVYFIARGATAPEDRGARADAEPEGVQTRAAERRARARRRGRARGGRGRGARAACSSSSTVLTKSKNPSTELHDCTIRESARARSRRHTAHTVCRAEHLSHDMDHTQTVTVNSLSRHSLLTQRDAQPAHRPPPAGAAHDPGGTMSCAPRQQEKCLVDRGDGASRRRDRR